ncbi:MAG: ligase-associated DNA damage response exonuclease [Limisphaerales bacterium]
MVGSLLSVTDRGLYCAAGDFYIDPWRGVERAVITHGHSDHARAGSAAYLCSRETVGLIRQRLGAGLSVEGLGYGEVRDMNGVKVSLHPAGHVLGSAQVRVEYRGEVWVVSGDYKVGGDDPTCSAFEPVRCDTFITESTFGLPVYRWPEVEQVFGEINAWWRGNRDAGVTSVLYAYSLGKAQRVLAGVDAGIGPILVHDAVWGLLPYYREAGVRLPEVARLTRERLVEVKGQALVVAPPGAADSTLLRAGGVVASAFASGWMLVRGVRRRRGMGRGFVVSDHADWPGLLAAVDATGASRVLVTHGTGTALVRWLREDGRDAELLSTPFRGEGGE